MSKQTKLILTGDLNFMGLKNVDTVFERVREELFDADAVISNLECCFHGDQVSSRNQSSTEHFYPRSGQREGFYADKQAVSALKSANISLVGNANNCNYGDDAIRSTISVLKEKQIPFSGVGENWHEAQQPAFFQAGAAKIGFIQRTSVYWPNNHEASANNPGVATIKVHTAYIPKIDEYAANRPGSPPGILTWADPIYKNDLIEQIHKLKDIVDLTVVSFHWGFKGEVLEYMREIAHAAIDAGADVVFGHGPHMPLPVEIYSSKPIFYGLGSFVFHNGHRGKEHDDWIGMIGKVFYNDNKPEAFAFSFVRRDLSNQTYICRTVDEKQTLDIIKSGVKQEELTFEVKSSEVFFSLR